MTLEELRKIKSSQYVCYKGVKAYLYVFPDRGYYMFSNDPYANGRDPCPAVRSALGFSYSYWLADQLGCDSCNKHLNIMIPKKGRRPL